MLACYYSPIPETEVGAVWRSNSGREIRTWLRAADLINDNNRATERGKAWVRMICNTPLPVEKTIWSFPE
jgi:hypothetical protein